MYITVFTLMFDPAIEIIIRELRGIISFAPGSSQPRRYITQKLDSNVLSKYNLEVQSGHKISLSHSGCRRFPLTHLKSIFKVVFSFLIFQEILDLGTAVVTDG